MKIAFFDTKKYDEKYFNEINKGKHQITYFKENLNLNTINKTKGFDAVCAFVNTYGDHYILDLLAKNGVKFWLQRSMGYNKIDLLKAQEVGIKVFRVFNYSAESVAEFAAGNMMALNRNILKAHEKVQKYNFSLENLEGKVINNSVVGVIGAGKIGQCFIKIMKGMGAKVIVYDSYNEEHFPDLAKQLGFEYVPFTKLLKESDFISLHAPLLPSTKYLLDHAAVNLMKPGVIIVNTARGELMDIEAMIYGLNKGIIRGLASDVLEREEGKFYSDISQNKKEYQRSDPQWKELIKNDKVLITSHQAFLTDLALSQIAKITLNNADNAQKGDFSQTLEKLPNGKVRNG